MSRRTRRRRPKPSPEQVPAEPTTNEARDLTDEARARLRQRFACMRGRAVVFGVVPFGPVVEAGTPDEMVERTEESFAAEAKKHVPS